jgi:DNA-directed RNA polymerase specialized sigma24 family protein
MKDPHEQPDNHSEKINHGKSTKPAVPLEELILLMAMEEDDRPGAERAFNIIIDRFEPYLKNVCYKYLFEYRSYDENDLKTLVNNVLYLLFKNANHLLHIENIKTENHKEAILKAWLSKVASREANKMNDTRKDYYASMSVTEDFSTFADTLIDQSDEEEIPSSDEMKILVNVLNELNPREKDIILSYYRYLDGRRHLPPEEEQRLCDEYQILPDNLNHIKFRTFRKIKQKSIERMEIRNPGYRLRE